MVRGFKNAIGEQSNWGNDPGRGDTAFGVMPFVKIPTGGETSNDKSEGGLM